MYDGYLFFSGRKVAGAWCWPRTPLQSYAPATSLCLHWHVMRLTLLLHTYSIYKTPASSGFVHLYCLILFSFCYNDSAEVCVLSQASPCGICGDKVPLDRSISEYFVSPPGYHFTNVSYPHCNHLPPTPHNLSKLAVKETHFFLLASHSEFDRP